ncbi:hypothetical protein [Syntrophus sp. (in: bacteria)]|uniref:hypothetical protein n=1 Tax=Syntrophus sp. (in: bacteria) TaxID=48412 RepID=UPI00345E1520
MSVLPGRHGEAMVGQAQSFGEHPALAVVLVEEELDALYGRRRTPRIFSSRSWKAMRVRTVWRDSGSLSLSTRQKPAWDCILKRWKRMVTIFQYVMQVIDIRPILMSDKGIENTTRPKAFCFS